MTAPEPDTPRHRSPTSPPPQDLSDVTLQLDNVAKELHDAMRELREDSGPKSTGRSKTLIGEVQEATRLLRVEASAKKVQRDDAEKKKKRNKKWRNWIAAAVGALTPVGGYGYSRLPDSVQNEDVQDTIDTRIAPLEKAVGGCSLEQIATEECTVEMKAAGIKETTQLNVKKVDRLGDLHMEQRGLIIDVRDEDMKVQRKIAERLHVDLSDVPAEGSQKVKDAREQVKAYKGLKAAKAAKEAQKAGDPFAGL